VTRTPCWWIRTTTPLKIRPWRHTQKNRQIGEYKRIQRKRISPVLQTMSNEKNKLPGLLGRFQSAEIPYTADDSMRHWLVIIGMVTVVLLLLFSCLQCALKLRHIYQHTDLDESHHDHSSCTFYPKMSCGKTSKYRRCEHTISQETPLASVHVVWQKTVINHVFRFPFSIFVHHAALGNHRLLAWRNPFEWLITYICWTAEPFSLSLSRLTMTR
jgi:hypothetical protein